MKQFFKFMFASCLGSAILLIVAFFVLVGMIGSMASFSKQPVKLTENSVLHVMLNYDIPERTPYDELGIGSIDYKTFKKTDNTGMNDILNNLNRAAKDPKISGIYLDLSSVGTSVANMEEIRNKMIEFKQSGKFIVAYAENYSQSAYYLASVADKIFLNPDGGLEIKGLSSQVMFYKHLLEKLDVEMQIVRGPNNKFKSAVEPYFLDKMSAANREQMETLLNSMWGNIIGAISTTRNITPETINQLADNLDLLFDSNNALKFGFVDALYYEDQVRAELRTLMNLPQDATINAITNAQYAELGKTPAAFSTDEIAVIYAVGQIVDGEGTETTIGSETLAQTIREARKDNKVKAIVMRVNSPGGSALASEVIRREVELAKNTKPFIVSMGSYAASGGYWISTNADYIFADETTLTGSIGVFGTFPNLKGLLNKKLGLTFDVAQTNSNADFGNVTRPLSEMQYLKLQHYVGETYSDFVDLVSSTRHLRKTFVDSIGQGRVWSGDDALNLGLIDEIGGIEKAVAYAAQSVNLPNYKVIEMPRQAGIIEMLMNQTANNEIRTQRLLKSQTGVYYDYFTSLKMLSELEGVQAMLPFVMTIE